MVKISIIIPVYNVEEYLKQCLNSVINQTLKEIEIICIDDKSTDNSLKIIQEYALKDNRFVVIEQSVNQGQGVARNMSLKCAKGEYIMFLDPDDWLELNACEESYKKATENNSELLFFYSNTYRYFGDLLKKIPPKHHMIDKIKKQGIFYHLYNRQIEASVCCKIFKRSFLINNNIFFGEGRKAEDAVVFFKYAIFAKKTDIINKRFYNRRVRVGQARYNSLTILNETKKNLDICFNDVKKYLTYKKDDYALMYYLSHCSYYFSYLNRLNKDNILDINEYNNRCKNFIQEILPYVKLAVKQSKKIRISSCVFFANILFFNRNILFKLLFIFYYYTCLLPFNVFKNKIEYCKYK